MQHRMKNWLKFLERQRLTSSVISHVTYLVDNGLLQAERSSKADVEELVSESTLAFRTLF